MPNPWRKATMSVGISRMIANIRSKRGNSSPLVVQTGFPTSLADIVVKNRSRLKKPKSVRKYKNKRSQESFGSRVSEVIEAVHLRDETARISVEDHAVDGLDDVDDVDRVDDVDPVDDVDRVDDGDRDEGELEILRVDCGLEEKTRLCEGAAVGEKKAAEKEEEEENDKDEVEEEKAGLAAVKTPVKSGGWRNRKIGCLANLFLFVVLAFYSKKLVLPFVAFAIALLFLECATNRLSTFLKSFPIFGEKMFEKETIELEDSSYSFSYHHNCSFQNDERCSRGKQAFSGERSDLCEETEPTPTTPVVGIPPKEVKKKKHWKKQVTNKLRRKENKDLNLLSPATVEESVERDDNDENSFNKDVESSAVDFLSDHTVKNKDGQKKKKNIFFSQGNLVMFVIVLSGLTGGRILALSLTVAWWYLAKVVQLLVRHWQDNP